MRRCKHQQCQLSASYNVEVSKTAVYCKKHAEDGMVYVRRKRCSHDSCTKHPSYNFKGRKTAMFCKQHSEDGMVDIINKLCSHDACTKFPSFNIEGSKTPAYCKQHAENGMVNVHKRKCCSHDSCTTLPSYSFEGSKTPVYCNQHAEDGMVNVITNLCTHDACTKHPSFNIEGSKMAIYCKQHAEDGMVYVRKNKCCSHDTCTTFPSFNFEGSKTAVYCSRHAEDGMVNVRTRRSSTDVRTAGPARSVPANVVSTTCTRHENDILDGSVNTSDCSSKVVNGRKRSRREVDGKKPPRTLDPTPFKVDLVQTVETGRIKEVRHASSPGDIRGHLSVKHTVGMSFRKTRQVVPQTGLPLPDEHQSGKPIKTEVEVDVWF